MLKQNSTVAKTRKKLAMVVSIYYNLPNDDDWNPGSLAFDWKLREADVPYRFLLTLMKRIIIYFYIHDIFSLYLEYATVIVNYSIWR